MAGASSFLSGRKAVWDSGGVSLPLSKCFQQNRTCVYMSPNTVIWPELCIYMRFFSTSKGHSEAPPYRISKEMTNCVLGWSVRLLLLESRAKVRLRRATWAFFDGCQVTRGRSEGWDTPSEVSFPSCSKLPIWPSGNAGKGMGALPTLNQRAQETLNMAELHLFFSHNGMGKKMSAAF